MLRGGRKFSSARKSKISGNFHLTERMGDGAWGGLSLPGFILHPSAFILALCLAPNFTRGLQHHLQFSELLVLGEDIAADA